jgi:eukaryotic-like serine/threonine-protein kinase
MITNPGQRAKELYEFGPFRVDPERETLLREGEPVPLTSKTFQILLVLIRHSEEVVTKDELMKAVWPDTFVEEANLSRNIFMLRKALGETAQDHRYIVTVPGRGYRLAENVHLIPEQEVKIVAATHSIVHVDVKESRPWRWRWLAVGVVILLVVGLGMCGCSSSIGGRFWGQKTQWCLPILRTPRATPCLTRRFVRGWRSNWSNRLS